MEKTQQQEIDELVLEVRAKICTLGAEADRRGRGEEFTKLLVTTMSFEEIATTLGLDKPFVQLHAGPSTLQ